MSAIREQKSLGELFAELSDETRTLIRQEMLLAKTELSEKASVVGKDVGSMVAGGAVAYLGLAILLASVVIGLGHAIGYGWSALLIGVITLAVGGFLVMSGLSDMKKRNLKPEKTVQSIQETKQWARGGMR